MSLDYLKTNALETGRREAGAELLKKSYEEGIEIAIHFTLSIFCEPTVIPHGTNTVPPSWHHKHLYASALYIE